MPTDSKLKCRKVFVLPIEEFLRESTAEAQQQCVENNRYVYELFPVRSKVLPKLRESTKRVMMKSKIVEQTVRWLEKIGICVEYNAELQEFEFEYKGVCMIIHTDTPEGVLSFCCPYVFPDELSNENKIIYEKAKEWWTKHIDTEHCFCEFVDNDCAYICCLYGRNRKDALRKYELVEMMEDTINKWKLFMVAISIAKEQLSSRVETL